MINYKNLTLTKEDPSVPFLNTVDIGVINKFFVTLDEYDVTCYSLNELLNRLKKKATNLIAYFKLKYNLE